MEQLDTDSFHKCCQPWHCGGSSLTLGELGLATCNLRNKEPSIASSPPGAPTAKPTHN